VSRSRRVVGQRRRSDENGFVDDERRHIRSRGYFVGVKDAVGDNSALSA
jgi:hypothetical protein